MVDDEYELRAQDPVTDTVRWGVARLLEQLRVPMTTNAALSASNVLKLGYESLMTDLVRSARHDGTSWADIGAALGISAQAAHQRYRHVSDSA